MMRVAFNRNSVCGCGRSQTRLTTGRLERCRTGQPRHAITEGKAAGLRPTERMKFEGVEFPFLCYANQLAWARVDLEIPARDYMVQIGPSGAGKTTLVDLTFTDRSRRIPHRRRDL